MPSNRSTTSLEPSNSKSRLGLGIVVKAVLADNVLYLSTHQPMYGAQRPRRWLPSTSTSFGQVSCPRVPRQALGLVSRMSPYPTSHRTVACAWWAMTNTLSGRPLCRDVLCAGRVIKQRRRRQSSTYDYPLTRCWGLPKPSPTTGQKEEDGEILLADASRRIMSRWAPDSITITITQSERGRAEHSQEARRTASTRRLS